MEDLKIVNPKMMKYGKKFIQWGDGEDGKLMERLIVRGIYIDGFVNCDYAGEKWCNKRFFEEEYVRNMQDACVLVRDLEQDDEAGSRLLPFVLNPDVAGCEVLIYGSGNYGMEALKYLETQPVRIKGFVDSNPIRQGSTLNGYEIYPPEIIGDMSKSPAVVLATATVQGRQQMEETARKYARNVRTYYYAFLDLWTNCGDLINANQLSCLCKAICRRRIYLYGTDKKMKEYVEFFHLHDLVVKGVLADSNEMGESALLSGLEKRRVEEILYENDFCIIICSDEERKSVDKLESLGMKESYDYFLSSHLAIPKARIGKYAHALDTNLGYTYMNKSGEYGVSKLLARCEERYKIAVLGGSTTDGELYPFRSWAECLWNKVSQDYISIYNYGVNGYNSGHEMIRLARDIISQKPDMVLALNGVNDADAGFLRDRKNIFDFSYLNIVMEFAGRNLVDGTDGDNRKVYGGEKACEDDFSRWLLAVEMMGAIADFFHIPFFDFLQPMLHDKPERSKGEELLACAHKNWFERRESFRMQFFRLKEKNGHITDLSNIFDDVHDVYMDYCHVNEKGNAIIAENIYNVINPVLQTWQIGDEGW